MTHITVHPMAVAVALGLLNQGVLEVDPDAPDCERECPGTAAEVACGCVPASGLAHADDTPEAEAA